jgi:hypothetical protein
MGSSSIDKKKVCLRFITVSLMLTIYILSSAQADTKTIPDVREILGEADHLASALDIRIQVQLLPKIALAKAGDQIGARTILRSMVEEVSVLQDKAPDYIVSDSDGYPVSWDVLALLEIASAQGETNDITARVSTIERARQLAERFENGPSKIFSLQLVAVSQIKSGDIKGANVTMQKILQVEDAIPANNNFSREFFENHVAMKIAVAQIETGDRTSARAAITQALQRTKKSTDDRLFRDIAIAQAKIGDAQAAMATTLKNNLTISNVVYVAEALNKAGEEMAAGDVLQKTVEIAQKTDTLNAFDWNTIAMAKIQIGDIQGAIEAQKRSKDMGVASNHTVAVDRFFLAKLAIAKARVGDVKGALQTFDAIPKGIGQSYEPFARASFESQVLSAIAAAQVKAGDMKDALAWARNQHWPDERAYALLGVAEGLIDQKGSKKSESF